MPGSNALKYNDSKLFEMQKVNFRRIEYKLRERRYIKFTEEMIEDLHEIIGDCSYKLALENHFDINVFEQEQLEKMLSYLHKAAPGFFVEQEPNKDDLTTESFFEKKLDAGFIMLQNSLR